MLNQQKMKNECSESKIPAGKTKGRQKIEIKQLENRSSLHVTFTKRRNGLFKKASELCVLSGAKMGIVVLSPTQKPYCFGHPNIDTILEQYLNNNGNPIFYDDDDDEREAAYLPAGFDKISRQYEESLMELEKEKERAKDIEEAKKVGNNGGCWWDIEDVDGMGLEELEAYMKAIEELKINLMARADSLMMANVPEAVSQADVGYGFGFGQNPGLGGTYIE
ncbi:hypothetical protein PTKIN_Ptkin04bG0115900 [Pterospermum kingtungense]